MLGKRDGWISPFTGRWWQTTSQVGGNLASEHLYWEVPIDIAHRSLTNGISRLYRHAFDGSECGLAMLGFLR
jgi:hypothetical protein